MDLHSAPRPATVTFHRHRWSLSATTLFLVASVWVVFNVRRWNNREILQWDTDGYYLYLPAVLIHGDLFQLAFLDSVPPGRFPKNYRFGQGAFRVEDTGLYCDKYTLGTALFELPFFLAAHAWCSSDGTCTPDGYSPPYHLAVALASAFWPWLGLLLLLRFLRRRLGDLPTALALLGLGLGTNLFFYSSFAGGMSHPFLFFLCALLIERTDRWYERPSLRAAMVIGLCVGWATLTRPTCALLGLIPLCWMLLDDGPAMLRAHTYHLVAAVLTAACCVLPQLLYWKTATGSFLFWSYGEEGFDLSHPHVIDGLFSFRKGWFVYTPLALIAFAGLTYLTREPRGRSYTLLSACLLTPFILITFSWDPWWYGGGFGSRPMIDVLPVLALPLASWIHRALSARALHRTTMVLLLTACIVLNLFQQWQYQRGIIHHEAMTFERWTQVFGRTTRDGLPEFP